MNEPEDVIKRDEELTQRIIAIPQDKVFRKINVLIVLGLLAAFLIVAAVIVVRTTGDTREAVKSENAALTRENERLEAEITAHEDVIDQAINAILQLSDQIIALGGEPPEIVLRPTTTTEPEEG